MTCWASWLCRPGICARRPATRAPCWLTSSSEAVPTVRRPWMAARICSASRRLRRTMAMRSASASAWNQVLATEVTVGERHRLLVEAAEQRAGLRTVLLGAQAAPEVQLVADAGADAVGAAVEVVAAVRRGGGGGDRGGAGVEAAEAPEHGGAHRGAAPAGGAGALVAGLGRAVDGGQQGRAADADLGIGLADAGDGGLDVEVGPPRVLDEGREDGRVEAAPPVRRGPGGLGGGRGRAIGGGKREIRLCVVGTEVAGGKQQQGSEEGRGADGSGSLRGRRW